MPPTTVVFFQDQDGTAPVVSWLVELRQAEPRAFTKCLVRLERLRELGHELRRPETDTLRDGVHELRVRLRRVNYRILYSIHGRVMVVLLHALTKTAVATEPDIDLAATRKLHSLVIRTPTHFVARRRRARLVEDKMAARKRGKSPDGADAVRLLQSWAHNDAAMQAMVAEERTKAAVARQIYDLRKARGLTQQQLAALIGTKQPVIARLEDADYEGHSLAMLYRIGAALGCGVAVSFVPRSGGTPTTRAPGHRTHHRVARPR